MGGSLVGGQRYESEIMNGAQAMLGGDPASPPRDLALAKLLAMWLDSGSSEETHYWIGPPPPLSRWVDERVMMKLRAHGLTIPNLDYANGVIVHQNDRDDDKLGQIMGRIATMIEAAQSHYLANIMTLMKQAFVTPCFDGSYFIDDDHPTVAGDSSSPTWSNKQTGVLSETTLNAAIALLMKIPNEAGEPMGAVPTHVICGPDLRATLLGILADYGVAGASNVNAGLIEPIISARLDPLQWFVADLSHPGTAKPFVVQVRKPLTFTQADAPGSEDRFMRGHLKYGVEARSGFGYGLPHYIVGSPGV